MDKSYCALCGEKIGSLVAHRKKCKKEQRKELIKRKGK